MFGQLVLPAVFKTDVAGYPGQAGSIPVHLRRLHAVLTGETPDHERVPALDLA